MDKTQKTNLLADMKKHPCNYSRETMYEYISSGVLTYDDIVVNNKILNDVAFKRICENPNLYNEQIKLGVSNKEEISSKEGCLDILLFGIPGVGRRTMLAGLLNSKTEFDLSFNFRGTCSSYILDLLNSINTCSLPDSSNTPYIQLIEASFRNGRGQTSPISLIEMSGEKLVEFYQKKKS